MDTRRSEGIVEMVRSQGGIKSFLRQADWTHLDINVLVKAIHLIEKLK